MIEYTPLSKTCTVCGQSFLDTDEFFPIYKVRGKRYRRNTCRPCWRLRQKAHSDATREQDRARRHAWKAANPDKVAAMKRRNYERHRDSSLARSRRWMENNLEHARQLGRDAYYRSREDRIQKAMVHTVKRMARKLDLPDTFTQEDWHRALTYWHGSCAVCGRTWAKGRTIAMDHWLPLTDPNCPGTIPTNIIPLCHGRDGCNNSKGNREPIEWLRRKFGDEADAKLSAILAYFDWIVLQ